MNMRQLDIDARTHYRSRSMTGMIPFLPGFLLVVWALVRAVT